MKVSNYAAIVLAMLATIGVSAHAQDAQPSKASVALSFVGTDGSLPGAVVDGTYALDKFDVGISSSNIGSRNFAGVSALTKKFNVTPKTSMRVGAGFAYTSNDITIVGVSGGGLSSVASTPTTTSTHYNNSPYVQVELSYQLAPGLEAVAGVKHFTTFATATDPENRTFSGLGLRFTF